MSGREPTTKARWRFDRDPLYEQPNWVAAYARLIGLLPDVAETIPTPGGMAPDPILEAATAAGVLVEAVRMYNPWRADPAGRGVKQWESYSKLELFDMVFADLPVTFGPLWFIPQDCFGSREPYSVSGEWLREFINECPCSMNLDVLFIWEQSPRVSVIHHAGGFYHIVAQEQRGE